MPLLASCWVLISSFFYFFPSGMRLLYAGRHFSHTPLLDPSPHWLSSPPLSLSHLSLPHAHHLLLPCALLPPASGRLLPPTSLLGFMSYVSWGFPYPLSLLLPPRRRLPLLFFRLPAASSSFFVPHFTLTLFRSCLLPLPVPAPSLSSAPTSSRLLPPRVLPYSWVGSG